MLQKKFQGQTDGKGLFFGKSRDAFQRHLKMLAETKPEGEVEVIVQKPRQFRSKQQNGYYWGVVIRLINEKYPQGDKTQIHDWVAEKFLKICEHPRLVRSTTSLNTKEFEEYVEQVRAWAGTEEGISIPLPNEVDWELELSRV